MNGQPWPFTLRAAQNARRPNRLSCRFVEPLDSNQSHPHHQNEKDRLKPACFVLAERVGFEPTEGFPSLVFKTSPFNRSGTSP